MRPEASRGGRPSSVRALRRAAHYPPTTSASGSLRLASWRSRGRPPRTRFCRSLLGMAVSCIDGLCGRAESMQVPPLVWDRGSGLGHGAAESEWTIGEDPHDRHP